MAHAVTQIKIHHAQVAVYEQNGTIWLNIPAPHCDGDQSEVTAFLASREALGQLRDDINAVLDNLENPTP